MSKVAYGNGQQGLGGTIVMARQEQTMPTFGEEAVLAAAGVLWD